MLNFLYFTVYIQNYSLKSNKTWLNYSKLFKPTEVAFPPFLPLKVNFITVNG